MNEWKIVLRRWDGYHHHEKELTLEEFARLFTYGLTYTTRNEAPDPEIRVRPQPSDPQEKKR